MNEDDVKHKTIVVSGLARCGTSAMMQALQAAGLKCSGEYPSFEDDATCGKHIPNEYFAGYDAVKVLDPHYCSFDKEPPIAVLWMSRDFTEQAKSQDKFVRLISPDVHALGRRRGVTMKQMSRRLADEAVECGRLLNGIPKLVVEFDRLVTIPEEVCEEVAEFVQKFIPLPNPCAMSGEIVKRDPACAPDIAMELAQIASQRARAR